MLIVFLGGFRLVICQGMPQLEWAATIVLVSGQMWLTFSTVAQSMEGATAIVSKIRLTRQWMAFALRVNSSCRELLAGS
jgi:hypothetical protein